MTLQFSGTGSEPQAVGGPYPQPQWPQQSQGLGLQHTCCNPCTPQPTLILHLGEKKCKKSHCTIVCSWRDYPKAAIMPAIFFPPLSSAAVKFAYSEYGKDSLDPELSQQPVRGVEGSPRCLQGAATAAPVAAALLFPSEHAAACPSHPTSNSARLLPCL